ncbi:hypothetical protein F5Y13DRAFT_189997 [Hypoxylon sp. FL1857]|nr:hypothetical protein F5Y13DRAFT_189997 [Hypoxylon sp. FL1857]
MAQNVPTISIEPVQGETLFSIPLIKFYAKILFTYNTHDEADEDVMDSDSDLSEDGANDRSMNTFALSTVNSAYFPPRMNMNDFSHARFNKWTSTPDLRVIVSPGRPPFAASIPEEGIEIKLPKILELERPYYAFEDTCRAAMYTSDSNLESNLESIKDASFITDTDTLSYLYHIVQDKVANNVHPNNQRGIFITVHDVDGKTFLKSLNGYMIDRNHTATKHLRENTLRHYWRLGGGSQEPLNLNVYKEVISYRLGDYSFVVEDPDQVATTSLNSRRLRTEELEYKAAEIQGGYPTTKNNTAG